MADLQFGANVILMVWTYFRRGFNPVTADWSAILATRNDPQKKCQYKEISEEQRRLMERLCEAAGGDCESLIFFFLDASGPVANEEGTVATDYELTRADSMKKGLPAMPEYDRFRPEPGRPFVWERDLHFVSQMFKDEWQPEKTWAPEKTWEQ